MTMSADKRTLICREVIEHVFAEYDVTDGTNPRLRKRLQGQNIALVNSMTWADDGIYAVGTTTENGNQVGQIVRYYYSGVSIHRVRITWVSNCTAQKTSVPTVPTSETVLMSHTATSQI